MRHLILLFVASIAIGSCKKEVNQSTDSLSLAIKNDALAPLPCHSTAFSTAYKQQVGKIPPFFFSKTLYADTRVKSIHMISRAHPNYNHSMYNYSRDAYEWKGTFTYSTNAAKFSGTKELWSYYKTTTGSTARRSVEKVSVVYNFVFNPAGFCTSITQGNLRILKLNYANAGFPNTLSSLEYMPSSEGGWKYKVSIDSRGNPTRIYTDEHSYVPSVNYKYDYSRSGDRYNYQPSQYGVCQEFSFLEAMQWVPMSKNPRSAVSVTFIGVDSNESLIKVTQSQAYKNMKYDSKRNLISYTYADNVLQKTTWYCK